jgi:hypothetical protein
LTQGRGDPTTNLDLDRLALYYYKSAEIARIFASLKVLADEENQAANL